LIICLAIREIIIHAIINSNINPSFVPLLGAS